MIKWGNSLESPLQIQTFYTNAKWYYGGNDRLGALAFQLDSNLSQQLGCRFLIDFNFNPRCCFIVMKTIKYLCGFPPIVLI